MLESRRLLRLDGLLGAARSGVASMVSTVSAGSRAAGGWLHGARAALEGKLSSVQAAYAERRAADSAAVAAREPPAGDVMRRDDRAAAQAHSQFTQRERQSELAARRQIRSAPPVAADDASALGETHVRNVCCPCLRFAPSDSWYTDAYTRAADRFPLAAQRSHTPMVFNPDSDAVCRLQTRSRGQRAGSQLLLHTQTSRPRQRPGSPHGPSAR